VERAKLIVIFLFAVLKICNVREKCLLLILTCSEKLTRRLSTESGDVTNFETTLGLQVEL